METTRKAAPQRPQQLYLFGQASTLPDGSLHIRRVEVSNTGVGTIEDMIAMLGGPRICNAQKARRLLRSRVIDGYKVGATWAVYLESVAAYIAGQAED